MSAPKALEYQGFHVNGDKQILEMAFFNNLIFRDKEIMRNNETYSR